LELGYFASPGDTQIHPTYKGKEKMVGLVRDIDIDAGWIATQTISASMAVFVVNTPYCTR
jgi:hypothetical protein